MKEEKFKKKVSVVITTYNQQDTIARAIESVLQQKCQWPLEIIIGDDGSTDSTSAICKNFAERYPDIVRLYINKVNKGIVENYFSCLLRCEGKYIADLAGDDEWCDDQKLFREIEFLEEHEDVVLVHTDYRIRNEKDGTVSPAAPYPFQESPYGGKEAFFDLVSQRFRPLAHLCSSLYRNDAFLTCYRKYPKFFHGREYPCEDVQLTALLAFEGKLAYLPYVTLIYSVSSNSISNSKTERKAFFFKYSVLKLMVDLRDDIQLSHSYFSTSCQYRIYEILMHVFRLHEKDLLREVLSYFRKNDISVQTLRNNILVSLLSCSPLWSFMFFIRNLKKSLEK